MGQAHRKPNENRLLAALPPGSLTHLAPELELVRLRLGEVLHEPGVPVRYAYFPGTALVSLLNVIKSGASAEVALIGNDGMVGIVALLGGVSMPVRAVVQSAGWSHRVCTTVMAEAIDRSEAAFHVLLRYTQALITQMSQIAVCNRHHSIEQQVCRWLLMSMDCLNSEELVITQERIANRLGVRREGVTDAAGKLQQAGVIRYSRGRITVCDRPKLERLVCECYRVVKRETDRLCSPAHRTGTTPRAGHLRPSP